MYTADERFAENIDSFRGRNGGADGESDCLLCEPQKKQRIKGPKYK